MALADQVTELIEAALAGERHMLDAAARCAEAAAFIAVLSGGSLDDLQSVVRDAYVIFDATRDAPTWHPVDAH